MFFLEIQSQNIWWKKCGILEKSFNKSSEVLERVSLVTRLQTGVGMRVKSRNWLYSIFLCHSNKDEFTLVFFLVWIKNYLCKHMCCTHTNLSISLLGHTHTQFRALPPRTLHFRIAVTCIKQEWREGEHFVYNLYSSSTTASGYISLASWTEQLWAPVLTISLYYPESNIQLDRHISFPLREKYISDSNTEYLLEEIFGREF